MPKVRLHQRGRDALCRLAQTLVSCPKEAAASDAAYVVAADACRKMVETRFPHKDMLVLKKYEAATPDKCLRMNLVPGGFQVWYLRDDDRHPLQPKRHGCSTYAPDEATSIAVNKAIAAEDAHKKAKEKKLEDYYALISAATTFEAVLEVWPEAEAARGECGATQLTVAITPDIVKRIRADIAARQKAA